MVLSIIIWRGKYRSERTREEQGWLLRRGTKAVNVHQKASRVTARDSFRTSAHPLPSYTLTSLKVIKSERVVATHAMICTATGRTRHESAAMAARFFGVCCFGRTGPLAVVMA